MSHGIHNSYHWLHLHLRYFKTLIPPELSCKEQDAYPCVVYMYIKAKLSLTKPEASNAFNTKQMLLTFYDIYDQY